MTPNPRLRATCTSVVMTRHKPHDFQDLIGTGDLAMAQRDGDKAAGAYVAAMAQSDEDEPDLLVRLGMANLVRTRDHEAELCFREALALEPGNTAALRGLIAVHRERGQHEMAFAIEDRLFVDLDERTRVFELVESGDRWWGEGQLSRAKLRYGAALRIDGAHPRARKRMRDVVNAQLESTRTNETLIGVRV